MSTAADARQVMRDAKGAFEHAEHIRAARTYYEYRDQIDAAIFRAAMRGHSSCITPRPVIPHEASDVLQMRLERKGYRVRRMRGIPDFEIEWGDTE